LDSVQLSIDDSVSVTTEEEWNTLVGDGSPFIEWAWLRAMETSGAVDADRGWMPQILTARSAGQLVGAVPLYLKGHSYGEYVYDWAWADVARRMGRSYYPKLIAASPFTPVTGPRVLTHPELDQDASSALFSTLVSTVLKACTDNEIHGAHFLFVAPSVAEELGESGLIIRQAHQYHWKNHGYASFDEFLGRFRSKRRREIRRERRRLTEAGFRVDPVPGTELTEAEMDDVFRFYSSTCEKYMRGRQYLDRGFFAEIHRTMPERILAMLARDSDGKTVAGAFCLKKDDRLYGRYWGCDEDVRFLHFETCFYRPIEYAIENGLSTMEPGAGGDHKFVRGFEPVTMYSAHWLLDPTVGAVLAQAADHESRMVDETVEHLTQASPIRD
jgi:predicted N-acyltransferase